MARYIDIDDTVKTFEKLHGEESTLLNCYNADWIFSFLESQPTVDVQKVRHGKWIRGNYVCGEYEFKCSVCGKTEWHTSYSTPFCPHCGARMDLDENEYR